MPSWLQAVVAGAAFLGIAAVVGRRSRLSRLLRVAAAAFALLAVALILDALGLDAAGWLALPLIVSLFVVGAALAFVKRDDLAP